MIDNRSGLSKTFETRRARPPHLALTDISLDVADGEFVSILGPSGCGKSTLLYIVGGFVAPSTGAVTVNGPAGDRARARSRAGVPGIRAVSLEDRARQRDVRARAAGRARGAKRGARARELIAHGAPHRLRELLSEGTVRRHEAARRDRAHARLPAEHPADGRAVRRARRAHPHAPAERSARDLGARPQDRAVRHPQRRGGGVPVRPRGGDDALARPHQGDHADRAAAAAQPRRTRCSIAAIRTTSSASSG